MTGKLHAASPTVCCSMPLKHVIQENEKFCGSRFHSCLYRYRTGLGISMKELSAKTRVYQLRCLPELKKAAKYFIYGKGIYSVLFQFVSLEQSRQMGWCPESILDGVKRLREVAQAGEYLYPVYSREAAAADRGKRDVNVIFFPPKSDVPKHRYVVLAAGGAYMSVCSLAESYPVAARLNELGYPVFVLTYRVGGKGLFPKPLQDLAQALRWIDNHAEQFSVTPGDYILGGFSAGGNLTALWGTDNHGYTQYGMPKPKALFPIYPAINHHLYGEGKMVQAFCDTMFGQGYSEEKACEYDIDTHMSEAYPPCYIVACKDDTSVPVINSCQLKKELDALGVPAILEIGENGGHGFGEGRGTDVEGWVNRAVSFAEEL